MYQNYNIKQVCLPIDLEIKLEKNDFAHAVVQFVDSIPDEVFLPYYQSMGSPQYHPRMLLSVILCAYCLYSRCLFGPPNTKYADR